MRDRFTGADDSLYDSFLNVAETHLNNCGLPKAKRIIVPGNHDISRAAIEPKALLSLGALSALDTEETFLGELESLCSGPFSNKFDSYQKFEKQFADFTCCDDKLGGKGWDLPGGLGVYCINTALCSFGGLEDKRTGKKIDDRGNLSIDTRGLYQWQQTSNSKSRILVMHHPIDWLSDWARIEIERVISDNFDLVLFGHFHLGNANFVSQSDKGSVLAMAPPLFTRKNEPLGYSIITFDTEPGDIEIRYRDWSQKNKFVTGSSISGTDDGILRFNVKSNACVKSVSNFSPPITHGGTTESILESEFFEASTSCSSKRQVWVNRDFSRHSEAQNSRELKETSPPDDIVEKPRSCCIRAPKGFGLSAYARFAALEHYRNTAKKKALVVINTDEVPHHKVGAQTFIEERCKSLGLRINQVSAFVFDGWTNSSTNGRIYRYIKELHETIPIIFLQGFDDFLDVQNTNIEEQKPNAEIIYLKSLSRSRIRELSRFYIAEAGLDLEEDIVANKLIEDIDALNMHRTPLNCLLLLKSIERAFDESPVNRTQMISNVLFSMFYEFDKIPKYSTRPDLKDCEFALGFLSEWLIRSGHRSFTRSDFLKRISAYLDSQLIDLDVDLLFNFLFTEKILISRGTDFRFRHGYWLCYFTAQRMHHCKEFRDFILSDLRYAALPEVIEFYTGIDRMRDDAIQILDADLRRMDAEFISRTGIAPEFNPFSIAEWRPSNDTIEKMQLEVVDSIRESSLPSEVKDAVADGTYDCSKPYHQEVAHFISKSSLAQMIQAMKGAARALRNSDHVSPLLKAQLLESVVTCWVRMCQTLAMLSPVLACNRVAEYDGIGFLLSDSFKKEDSPDKIWKEIIEAITNNVVNWYQRDLFSKKLTPLLKNFMKTRKGSLEEFLVLYAIIIQRPTGWNEVVEKYVIDTPKNSFYLYKTYNLIRHEFRVGFAKEHTRQELRKLAAVAVARHETGVKRPNNRLIEKAGKLIDKEMQLPADDEPTQSDAK